MIKGASAAEWRFTQNQEGIKSPKEKGAVGAPRAFISSDGAGSLGPENYTLKRERAVGERGPGSPEK